MLSIVETNYTQIANLARNPPAPHLPRLWPQRTITSLESLITLEAANIFLEYLCYELLYEISKKVISKTGKQESQNAAKHAKSIHLPTLLSTPKSSSDHALSAWPSSDVLHFDSNEVFNELDVCSGLLWQVVERLGSGDWLLPALKFLVLYLDIGE